MNLEHQEIEAIAGLKDQFGYKMLLDKIQAELDTIQQDILTLDRAVNKETVILWKALYHIYTILKLTPEDMSKELQNIKQFYKDNQEESLEQVPKEYLEVLLKAYENKKAKR